VALTISNEATANSLVSGSTLTLTATAAVGTVLVLGVAADNAGTSGAASLSSTVTDSAGNTWINRSLITQTAGVVSDGTTLGIWTCMVGAALVAGTVTISFSPNTTAKAAVLQKVTPAAGEMVLVASVGAGSHGNGTTWAAPTVSVAAGDTIFGFVAVEGITAGTADSDTTNGSWSAAYTSFASTGTVGTSQSVGTQHKTVTAAGNQTFDETGGSTRDYAINHIVLSPLTATLGSAGIGAASWLATAIGAATFAAAGVGTFSPIIIRPISADLRVSGRGSARWIAIKRSVAPGRRTARILFRFDWADDEVSRLWLGAGIYVDADGDLWRGAGLVDDSQLDDIEQAVNGNASALNVGLSGVSPQTAGLVWARYQDGNLIGSTLEIMIQPCDARHRPVGAARVVFGGNLDNVVFEDTAADDGVTSTVTAQVTNKFQVRNLTNGAVLSDPDQRARSAILNPGANPDRFAERTILMQTKSLVWPRFSG
jgi:hypothetical protein